MINLSREAVRRLSIMKQGLHHHPTTSDKSQLKHIIRQIGLLQLDSISVTARSHYLVMLARAGIYDRAALDALLAERDLFEYWAHAACLIPIEHFAYYWPIIQENRDFTGKRMRELAEEAETLQQWVMDEIRQNGPMAAKDFESEREGQASWWNWKPAKVVLEHLFDHGRLMASHREKFHRYYDLSERVLHGLSVDTSRTMDDFNQWATLAGLRHIGIATVSDIADYYRIHKTTVKRILEDGLTSGTILAIEIDGHDKPAFIHRDDVPLLDQLAACEHTAFLSPFDNLIWFRERDEWLFDFFYRIEVYTPAAKRQYGYYVMPILHRDQLVGRIDPKIDRKAKHFYIRALHLEPQIVVTEDLVEGVWKAIQEFMTFHNCESSSVEQAPDNAEQLKQALG